MARRRKSDADITQELFPPDFWDGRKQRKARIEWLYRQRIDNGPSALFDTKKHKLRYAAADTLTVLIRFRKTLIGAGYEPIFSIEEANFMKQYGKFRQVSK